MAASTPAASIVSIHSQHLDRRYRKSRLIIARGYPVPEFRVHDPFIAVFTGSPLRPAAKRRLPKIIVQAIITCLGAFPINEKRYLAIWCPFINDAKCGPDLEQEILVGVQAHRKQDQR